jgi:hypothetical protein
MNRRQALQKAWHKKTEGYAHPTSPNYESGFVEGFNAAWAALLAEIREVETKAEEEWKANGLETICSLDCLIDMRLREHLRKLVREGE